MEKIQLDSFLFLLDDFLTAEECDKYIEWSEEKGYEEAKIQVDGKQVTARDVRNNSRITFIDEYLAHLIWEKFNTYATVRFANSAVCGLNEMFRFYKYEAGQQFKKHIDGSYIRNEEESSYFTLMIYLNDNFLGGETKFQYHTVNPKKGRAVIFYHGMAHSGEAIREGVKYVLRTDVMYKLIK